MLRGPRSVIRDLGTIAHDVRHLRGKLEEHRDDRDPSGPRLGPRRRLRVAAARRRARRTPLARACRVVPGGSAGRRLLRARRRAHEPELPVEGHAIRAAPRWHHSDPRPGHGVVACHGPHDWRNGRQAGGSAIEYRFAADGSIIAIGTGLLFAWYLPGDDSQLGPGLFLVNGRVREVYDTDGNFVSATFSGKAIDVCEALGD